jgi:hypothetical protein
VPAARLMPGIMSPHAKAPGGPAPLLMAQSLAASHGPSMWTSLSRVGMGRLRRWANNRGKSMSQRHPWTKADVIALVVGGSAFLLTLAQWIVPPIYRDVTQPEVTISSPSANYVTTSKGFSVTGPERNISPDNDLWLIIRQPNGFSFPVLQIDAVNGQWNVAAHYVCFLLGPGSQNLQVWMIPETSDGPLFIDMARQHALPIDELPPESVLQTYVIIRVPLHTHVRC